MKNQRILPHFRQSDAKRNCGAACIAMLLKHFRMKGKIGEITQEVNVMINGFMSCRNSLMLKYMLEHNLRCAALSALDLKTFLGICAEAQFEVILSYRPLIGYPGSHMVVVSCFDDTNVYVNSPEFDAPRGVNVPLSFDFLRVQMLADKRLPEATMNNMIIVVDQKSSDNAWSNVLFRDGDESHEIPLPDALFGQYDAFIDPYLDAWASISQEQQVSE